MARKVSKNPSKKVFDTLAYAVAEYIKGCGGNAVVIGGIRIAQRPPLKYNFTMEIDFTGIFPGQDEK